MTVGRLEPNFGSRCEEKARQLLVKGKPPAELVDPRNVRFLLRLPSHRTALHGLSGDLRVGTGGLMRMSTALWRQRKQASPLMPARHRPKGSVRSRDTKSRPASVSEKWD